MEITNPPQQVPYITTQDGQKLSCYIKEIGDWNMDAFAQKWVTHGLGTKYADCRAIQVLIRNDTDDFYFQLYRFDDNADPSLVGGGIVTWDNTQIQLERRTGGIFDSVNFDSTSYNRGWIIIWVVV